MIILQFCSNSLFFNKRKIAVVSLIEKCPGQILSTIKVGFRSNQLFLQDTNLDAMIDFSV